MKKKNAVLSMILFLVALVGLGYVALVGIGPTKTGSAANIKQGLDLAGGVSITYQVVGDEKPSDADMQDTIYKLQKRVEGYSTEAQVYQEGEDRINIEIPGVTDANKILEELGQPGSLYFIAQTDDDGNQNYTITGIDENGKYALKNGYVQLNEYTIEEVAVKNYDTTYDGYNIIWILAAMGMNILKG